MFSLGRTLPGRAPFPHGRLIHSPTILAGFDLNQRTRRPPPEPVPVPDDFIGGIEQTGCIDGFAVEFSVFATDAVAYCRSYTTTAESAFCTLVIVFPSAETVEVGNAR